MTDKYANLRARLAALRLAGPVSTDAAKWNAATDALDVELVAELLAERDAMVQAQPAAVSDEEIDRIIERAGEAVGMSPGGWDVVDPRELVRAILALRPQAEPFGFVNKAVAWGAGQSEMVVKITRKSQPEYGFTHAVYAAGALRPQAVPMTQKQVVDAFCATPHQTQYVSVFNAGVRAAEAHHGITAQAKEVQK